MVGREGGTAGWIEVRRLRRNLRLPFALVAMSLLALAYAAVPRDPSMVFAVMLAVLLPVFAFFVVVRNAFPRALRTRAKLTETELMIDGRAPIARNAIVELRMKSRFRREGDTVLELATDQGERERLWLDGASARTLYAAIGPRRARFRLALPFGTRFLAGFVIVALPSLGLAIATHAPAIGIFSLVMGGTFWALVVALLLWFVPGDAVVGADGVTTRFLAIRRFIPFGEIAEVRARPRSAGHLDSILVRRRGGQTLLVAREAPDTEVDRGAEGAALFEHLAAAFAAWQGGGGDRSTAALAALVAPEARSAGDWRAALDLLASGAGGYRSANVSAERLEMLVGDPAAEARARVGAAAALVRIGDDGARARVRVVAASTADAILREAMLAVADADSDESLERALNRALR